MKPTQVSQSQPELRIQQGQAARASWQIKAFRLVVRGLFQLLFRVRVIGLENVPRIPAVICFNHLGWAEGFMVLLFFPVEPRIYGLGERHVAYLSRWRTRMLNWLQIFIPLERDKPRRALQMMKGILERGGSLALAPEGRLGNKEGTVSELQHGAAYLSQISATPLIPVGVTGCLELWLRRHITMRIGQPLYPDQFEGDMRTRIRAMTARLDKDMRALLPGDFEQPRFKPLRDCLTKLF